MNKTIRSFQDFIWIDIENPTDVDLNELRLPFEIDENFLEDALEAGHLPKFEKTKEYIFMILRAYTADDNEKAIEVGEISNKLAFFVHDRGLLTIHRAPFKFLDRMDEHYDSVDALVMDLVNVLLVSFDKPLRNQSDRMDKLERNIFLQGGNNLSIEYLYYEKAKARLAKKILFIMQGVINQFKVSEDMISTLQDLKDTILDLLLRTEEVIEDSNALLNSYMTFTAQKSNDVMKLLTVFSAFFLPLTFIAGVYGMNFKNMPELDMKYGYYLALGVMAVISLIIYYWFKRKKIL